MTVKLLTEHHLEFLSLKGGFICSSEYKMPYCWKSHVTAQLCLQVTMYTNGRFLPSLQTLQKSADQDLHYLLCSLFYVARFSDVWVNYIHLLKVVLLKIKKYAPAPACLLNEPVHEISNNVVCATSKGSDQPAHTRSLIRAFASRLNILRLLSHWLNTIWSFQA